MNTVERAFELARLGDCRSLKDIRRALVRENHPRVDEHLSGTTIRRQLGDLIRRAHV